MWAGCIRKMIAPNKANLPNSQHWPPQLTIALCFYRENHWYWETGPILFILICQGLYASWFTFYICIISFLCSVLGDCTWCGGQNIWMRFRKPEFEPWLSYSIISPSLFKGGSTMYACDYYILPTPFPQLFSLIFWMTRTTCSPPTICGYWVN